MKTSRWGLVGTVALLLMASMATADEVTIGPFVDRLRTECAYLFTTAELTTLNSAASLISSGAAGAEDTARTDVLNMLDASAVPLRITDDGTGLPQASLEQANMPGDRGHLIVRIDKGNTGLRLESITSHLGDDYDGFVPVDTPDAGLTWAVISLLDIPDEETWIYTGFLRTGGTLIKVPLELVAPRRARLKVNLLSDETGESTPAMVRLTWKTTNNDRTPSNAVDLQKQFDWPGMTDNSRRPTSLPWPLNGYYWCVPGSFDMALPPGDWEIVIRRGTEYLSVFDSFSLSSGQTLEKTYTPQRWINMPQLGWYSADVHMHGRLLDDVDAESLMTYAKAEGVHVANLSAMGDIDRTNFHQRGFGPDYRVQDGNHALVPGQEAPRTHGTYSFGHTLQLNTREFVRDPDNYFLYDLVYDRVHAQGGLCGYAHALGPVMDGVFGTHRDMAMNIPKGKIDFMEIMQMGFLGPESYYTFLNLGYRMTAAAGTDTPYVGNMGDVRVFAYTGSPQLSVDDWFQAFGDGHTFVTTGPMLSLDIEGSMPGDTLTLDTPRTVRVVASVRGHADFAAPTKLEIIRHGEVIHTVTPTTTGQEELTCDIPVDAGYGCWIAVRAEAGNFYKALTTPVYVEVGGLRFWKYSEVEALIAGQEAVLDNIEEIVAQAEVYQQAGALYGIRDVDALATLADAVRTRVADARTEYDALRTAFAAEAAARAGEEGGTTKSVPKLTDLDQTAALQALVDAGLVQGNVVRQLSADVPAGQVVDQDPQPFTSVTAGFPVDMVISDGTGTEVFGTVRDAQTDAPLAGAQVTLLNTVEGAANSNGQYRFAGFPLGFHYCTASATAYDSVTQSFSVDLGGSVPLDFALQTTDGGGTVPTEGEGETPPTEGEGETPPTEGEGEGETPPAEGEGEGEGGQTTETYNGMTREELLAACDVDTILGVGATDVQTVINHVLNPALTCAGCDINRDSEYDAVDIQLVITAVLLSA